VAEHTKRDDLPRLIRHEDESLRRTFRRLLRADDSYGLLCILLLLDLLVAAFVATGPGLLILMALVASTLLLALRTSLVGPKATRFAYFAVGAGVVFGTVAAIQKSELWAGWMFAMMAALLLVTPAVIGRRLLQHKRVTAQTILGAVAIYLIFGLLFAFIYLSIRFISGQPFFNQGDSLNPINYIYMSYITITTVGYGDFTPAADYAKMLVVVEALIGQVFLVTTVARLVSLYGREERGVAGPAEDPGSGGS
jgi:hypothetical protein